MQAIMLKNIPRSYNHATKTVSYCHPVDVEILGRAPGRAPTAKRD